MEKLPRIIDCEFSNIYGETVVGVLVPMSSLTREKITTDIEDFANKIKKEKTVKIEEFKKQLEDENLSIEELRDVDTKSKVFDILMESGKPTTEEEINKYITKHAKILVNNKTNDELINGIATKKTEMELTTKLGLKTIGYTIFYSLRTKDDKRVRLYDKPDLFLDEITNETLLELYNLYNKDIDIKEEEVKN
ncbi:MAG: hypothetical protein PHN69_02410 [Candidatus Pacebacteria bacterium]|nr:hypothetical protein [Candidatus Paceibacterota bacterium]